MILKYQKITDKFTTRSLKEPDYKDGDAKITEICTIGEDTYVHVPKGVVLPEQSFDVDVTMQSIALDDELKKELKALSPHVRLINARVLEKIREKYTINDEFKMLFELSQGTSKTETDAYISHIKSCRAWGQGQKEKIGVGL